MNILNNSESIEINLFFTKKIFPPPPSTPRGGGGGGVGGRLSLGNTQTLPPGHEGSRFYHSQLEISDSKKRFFSMPSVSLLLRSSIIIISNITFVLEVFFSTGKAQLLAKIEVQLNPALTDFRGSIIFFCYCQQRK